MGTHVTPLRAHRASLLTRRRGPFTAAAHDQENVDVDHEHTHRPARPQPRHGARTRPGDGPAGPAGPARLGGDPGERDSARVGLLELLGFGGGHGGDLDALGTGRCDRAGDGHRGGPRQLDPGHRRRAAGRLLRHPERWRHDRPGLREQPHVTDRRGQLHRRGRPGRRPHVRRDRRLRVMDGAWRTQLDGHGRGPRHAGRSAELLRARRHRGGQHGLHDGQRRPRCESRHDRHRDRSEHGRR